LVPVCYIEKIYLFFNRNKISDAPKKNTEQNHQAGLAPRIAQGEPLLAFGQNAPRNKKSREKNDQRRGCFLKSERLKRR
jgi:hypothetical protein